MDTAPGCASAAATPHGNTISSGRTPAARALPAGSHVARIPVPRGLESQQVCQRTVWTQQAHPHQRGGIVLLLFKVLEKVLVHHVFPHHPYTAAHRGDDEVHHAGAVRYRV